MKKADLKHEIIKVVADGLTEPQRKALLWLPADGAEKALDKTPRLLTCLYGLKGREVIPGVEATLAGSRRSGLGFSSPELWSLTKLGQKVRAVIEVKQGA